MTNPAPYIPDYIRITPFPNGTAEVSAPSASGPDTGKIVGGVVGGVGGFLLLLVLGVALLWRRKRRPASSDGVLFHRNEGDDILSEPRTSSNPRFCSLILNLRGFVMRRFLIIDRDYSGKRRACFERDAVFRRPKWGYRSNESKSLE